MESVYTNFAKLSTENQVLSRMRTNRRLPSVIQDPGAQITDNVIHDMFDRLSCRHKKIYKKQTLLKEVTMTSAEGITIILVIPVTPSPNKTLQNYKECTILSWNLQHHKSTHSETYHKLMHSISGYVSLMMPDFHQQNNLAAADYI